MSFFRYSARCVMLAFFSLPQIDFSLSPCIWLSACCFHGCIIYDARFSSRCIARSAVLAVLPECKACSAMLAFFAVVLLNAPMNFVSFPHILPELVISLLCVYFTCKLACNVGVKIHCFLLVAFLYLKRWQAQHSTTAAGCLQPAKAMLPPATLHLACLLCGGKAIACSMRVGWMSNEKLRNGGLLGFCMIHSCKSWQKEV